VYAAETQATRRLPTKISSQPRSDAEPDPDIPILKEAKAEYAKLQ
jgi:hypothetical protein